MTLVDRWHLETHMFHLSCSEMASMLEDVSLLMGLPCAGAIVGTGDMGVAWHDKLLGRFSIV